MTQPPTSFPVCCRSWYIERSEWMEWGVWHGLEASEETSELERECRRRGTTICRFIFLSLGNRQSYSFRCCTYCAYEFWIFFQFISMEKAYFLMVWLEIFKVYIKEEKRRIANANTTRSKRNYKIYKYQEQTHVHTVFKLLLLSIGIALSAGCKLY